MELEATARFMGRPGFVQEGYVAGLAGATLTEPSVVTLNRPVVPGTRLLAEVHGAMATVRDGQGLVAEALPAALELTVPEVSWGEAVQGGRAFSGVHRHPSPECIGCGTRRPDGLRLFPGPVPGRALVACGWIPPELYADADGMLEDTFVWSALACAALWAAREGLATGPRVRVAQLGVSILGNIFVDVPHIVVGWLLERDAERVLAAAAILSPRGKPLAVAQETLVMTEQGFALAADAWGDAGPLPPSE